MLCLFVGCVHLREGFVYEFCLRRADELCQFLVRHLLDAFHALVAGEEKVACFLADAGYLVEGRLNLLLAAPVAVVGDAEAVGFVAHLLNEAQTFAVFVEIEGYGVVGEENLFEAFGDADDGNLQL